ncbi:XRE family transcriptional regulator [Sinorhizobium meliloti]|jgi:transcriptional regulator with XRE-family HTH domain|uniref:helix-turn-helix domain-containing protein n=1 Tax=Rhizobium meliloti TaxID=382 RepID=UPI000B49BDB6|nr:helix-turn-helix transcriptional regulator [Sinorhizobium meliloti]ASJ58963.1 hypothetical protein SMB554_07025 [Sinorhizobium meliloti]ASQ11865.1 XRE family transcriptional regulator [Sinorhizobium meliloti]MCK3783507.1 helix-turn-helix transcriptional regulator [Sinorhizobium meliloti]MCK3787863.1 helix-turn-helix transcriptional regulator [Sinorhizobium meliloti]MCK3794860.1 helix-turn-helix transcriptional regulator [Sinorhizobium meliloti]
MVTRIGPKKPFRHFLKEWRVAKGLTQQQLADRLPVGEDGKPTGKDQISRWERNERDMTMSVQAALAEALGFGEDPGKLFHDPEQPSIDDLLRSAPPERRRDIFVVVEAMLRTGTDG